MRAEPGRGRSLYTTRAGAAAAGGAELAVHDRCHRAADKYPRLADTHRHHFGHGAGRDGDGKPNFLGMVLCGDSWHRDRFRRATDRYLGTWPVRSLGVPGRNEGLTADLLFVGATRPPQRWGVSYAALLFNMVFTLEAFLVTRNLLVLLICAPIHGVCALLCARDVRFFEDR